MTVQVRQIQLHIITEIKIDSGLQNPECIFRLRGESYAPTGRNIFYGLVFLYNELPDLCRVMYDIALPAILK